MIRPFLQDDALLADIRSPGDAPRLWWLGQSGFLVRAGGRRLLIDPYLSDSLTRKYAGTDKPHVRMTERAIAPERLDFIDVVTSSHNHTDHLDAETLVPLLRVNPAIAVVVPAAHRAFAAERLGVDPARLTAIDDGGTIEAAGFRIHAVASAHETVERDEQGRAKFLGYVVEFDGRRLYHSGDCVPYHGLAERLAPWQVDVALLPVNGAAPERRVAGNFDGREAADLARAMGARLAVPCHYEMFEFNTASPDEFVACASRLGQPVRVLRCGEGLTLA
jgi:L-ascorbate metabolism protein UlaG (beta-lactamase superfamily)